MTRTALAPPGGSSSIVFGDDKAKAVAAPPSPAAAGGVAVITTTTSGQLLPSPFESLKLQAITTLTQLNSSADCEQMLRELLQSLASSGVQPKAVLTADDAIENLRAELRARGTHGIISIGKKFQSMDDNGDKKISFEEFSKAMKEMNIPGPDIHRLFRYFDADCSGYLSYEELLVGLRGQLNPRRLDMVQRAFKVFDKAGDGQVSLEDLKGRYNAKMHPDVLLGVKTEDEVLLEFMSTFEAWGGGTKGDGLISAEEFKKYYESVSASIDLDDYFELMIRNAWHISGGEGWCANTTCKRILVLHEDGSQSVHEIKDDFDVTKDQYLQKLKDQGVTGIKAIAAYGDPVDVLEGKASEPKSPMPAFGSGTPTPSSAGFASANKRGWQQRSSIHFG